MLNKASRTAARPLKSKPLPGRSVTTGGMADRANDAAQKARTEYDFAKISAADYGQALLKASEANAELAYRN